MATVCNSSSVRCFGGGGYRGIGSLLRIGGGDIGVCGRRLGAGGVRLVFVLGCDSGGGIGGRSDGRLAGVGSLQLVVGCGVRCSGGGGRRGIGSLLRIGGGDIGVCGRRLGAGGVRLLFVLGCNFGGGIGGRSDGRLAGVGSLQLVVGCGVRCFGGGGRRGIGSLLCIGGGDIGVCGRRLGAGVRLLLVLGCDFGGGVGGRSDGRLAGVGSLQLAVGCGVRCFGGGGYRGIGSLLCIGGGDIGVCGRRLGAGVCGRRLGAGVRLLFVLGCDSGGGIGGRSDGRLAGVGSLQLVVGCGVRCFGGGGRRGIGSLLRIGGGEIGVCGRRLGAGVRLLFVLGCDSGGGIGERSDGRLAGGGNLQFLVGRGLWLFRAGSSRGIGSRLRIGGGDIGVCGRRLGAGVRLVFVLGCDSGGGIGGRSKCRLAGGGNLQFLVGRGLRLFRAGSSRGIGGRLRIGGGDFLVCDIRLGARRRGLGDRLHFVSGHGGGVGARLGG